MKAKFKSCLKRLNREQNKPTGNKKGFYDVCKLSARL